MSGDLILEVNGQDLRTAAYEHVAYTLKVAIRQWNGFVIDVCLLSRHSLMDAWQSKLDVWKPVLDPRLGKIPFHTIVKLVPVRRRPIFVGRLQIKSTIDDREGALLLVFSISPSDDLPSSRTSPHLRRFFRFCLCCTFSSHSLLVEF